MHYTTIALLPNGIAPIGRMQRELVNSHFADEELDMGLRLEAGPSWQNPKKLLKEIRKPGTSILYVVPNGKGWISVRIEGEDLDEIADFLDGNKNSSKDSFELIKEFILNQNK